MTLEQQLAKLASLGLKLDDGVTIDDLLHSFDREHFEEPPFDLILFALGIEVERRPWGRPVCSRRLEKLRSGVQYASSGDYARIVTRLCQVAGQSERLRNISDFVDL